MSPKASELFLRRTLISPDSSPCSVIVAPLAAIMKIEAVNPTSRNCLTLEPNEYFKKAVDVARQKKQWISQLIKEDTSLLSIAVLGIVMYLFSQRLIDDILWQRLSLRNQYPAP